MRAVDYLHFEHRRVEEMLVALEGRGDRNRDLRQPARPSPSHISMSSTRGTRPRRMPSCSRRWRATASPPKGMIAAMKHQHEVGRIHLRDTAPVARPRATQRGRRGAVFATSARSYAELMRVHIQIEDDDSHPVADELLTAGENKALPKAFQMADTSPEAVAQHARWHVVTDPRDGEGLMADLLDDWRGKRFETVVADLRDLLEDADYPLRRCARPAAGCCDFQVYFPEEIAHAAGLLPLKIDGAQIEARQAEARFGSISARSREDVAELALEGRVTLETFVTHPIRRAQPRRGLGAQLRLPVRDPLPAAEPLGARGRLSPARVHDGCGGRFRGIAGREVTDACAARSIGVFNENRRLIRALYAIRRDSAVAPRRRRGVRATADRRLHHARGAQRAARRKCCRSSRRAPRAPRRLRVVPGGFCEQPPLDSAPHDCAVPPSSTTTCASLRWIVVYVEAGADSVGALASVYRRPIRIAPAQHDRTEAEGSACSCAGSRSLAPARRLSPRRRCASRGSTSRSPTRRRSTPRAFRHFVTEFEESMTTFDHLQIQLETFVEHVPLDVAPPSDGVVGRGSRAPTCSGSGSTA